MENDVESVVETKTTTKRTRKFKNNDQIPCRSVTSGELLMVGDKTGILYKWANYGDVQNVAYQDLLYAARSARTTYVKYPRFIIMDDDFVNQNPDVKKVYDKMYTNGDLRSIIKLPPNQMKKAIEELPAGARNSLKGLAATMISNGSLDSVQRIRLLDEIFGTEMLITLVEG